MANSINARASLRIDVVIDDLVNVANLSIVANREFDVADYAVAITAGQAGGRFIAINTQDPAGSPPVAIGNIVAAATGWQRPTVFTTAAADAGLASGAAVVRGNKLNLTASVAGIGANGSLSILPGNRYKAGAGTYYANNTTTGAQGSSATQSI